MPADRDIIWLQPTEFQFNLTTDFNGSRGRIIPTDTYETRLPSSAATTCSEPPIGPYQFIFILIQYSLKRLRQVSN